MIWLPGITIRVTTNRILIIVAPMPNRRASLAQTPGSGSCSWRGRMSPTTKRFHCCGPP